MTLEERYGVKQGSKLCGCLEEDYSNKCQSSKKASVPGGVCEEGSGGRMLDCELRAVYVCVSHSVVSDSL